MLYGVDIKAIDTFAYHYKYLHYTIPTYSDRPIQIPSLKVEWQASVSFSCSTINYY